MKSVSFNESRKIQYALLNELDSFCHQNGIQYFLGFGTLLGAVRHQGYIPWDDDTDVCMMRSEYERFVSLFKGTDKAELITFNNHPAHFFAFGRLTDKGTFSMKGNHQSIGITIDIYAMDYLPDDVNVRDRLIKSIYKAIKKNNFLFGLVDKFLYHNMRLFAGIVKVLQNKACCNLYNLAVGSSHTTSGIVADLCGTFVIQPVPAKCFEKSVNLQFEDKVFPAPAGYDQLLSIWYGDYMTLPPEENRVPYHNGHFYKKES